MLSIGKLVVGQQRYYERQVAQGGDDYYSGRGEAAGEWAGRGARALGLEGRVAPDLFNAMIAGADPTDPSVPLRSWRAPKVAALDLTFSAPKSVSVLFAIADEHTSRELVDAHEAAVRAAVEWIEDTAVQVRRGAQGRFSFPGDGLIAAAYRHRMSRALDPQLHTHVVAANLARGPDGRYTALDGTALYRAAKTGGYLYQAHLRAEISERLGLEWGPVRKGAADLKGVPLAVVEEFSRRRCEMQRAAQEGGFSLGTKRSAEAAAVDTRERKQYGVETHTWREEVVARAGEHGLGRDEVAGLIADGAARLGRETRLRGEDGGSVTEGGVGELADRLAGPAGVTERSNTFDLRVVLQQFAQAAGQGARVRSVRGRAEAFGRREDVLCMPNGAMTTTELVECERRLIDAAAGRAEAGCAVVSTTVIERGLAGADRPLTAEQERVVRSVASSGHGVDVVEALAGTGKTYTAGVLRALYESAGYRVVGVAPTGRGARELAEEAGIPACTIDRALLDLEQLGGWFAKRTVVVLDEAGMAPTRLTSRLLEHAARADAKVIAIGDSGQLASVMAGGWLRAVGELIGAGQLTEVMRQRDRGERRALAALHGRLPDRYIAWAEENGRIEVVGGDRIVEQAVGEWSAMGVGHAPGQAVMICRDNDTRAQLNELARAHRGEAGELGTDSWYGGTPVAVGDRVICRHNDSRVGVDNGTRGMVRHVDGAMVVLETDAGVVRELPASYVVDHVEHAYCLTGHGMQGASVERAVVVAWPQDLTAGWSYSALSRARGSTRLLIADTDRHRAARAEHAPEDRRPDFSGEAIIARAARQMRIRDDDDLAVTQLSAAGREDDPVLASHRKGGGAVLQEAGAERAEPAASGSGRERLIELRERIGRFQVALSALPTRPLARFDELDAKSHQLSASRAKHEQGLAALKQPARRFGRSHDPDAAQRAFLQTAIEIDGRALAELTADRARLQRELGDPDQVRSERDGIENAIADLQQERDQVLDALTQSAVDRPPQWLTEALGHRPSGARERDTWDHAARTVARFRLDHDIDDQTNHSVHNRSMTPSRVGSGSRPARRSNALSDNSGEDSTPTTAELSSVWTENLATRRERPV